MKPAEPIHSSITLPEKSWVVGVLEVLLSQVVTREKESL